MSLANIALVLALVFNSQISPANKAPKSVRVGDLLVTATRVWVPQVAASRSDRFHRVAVEVTVKNVSGRISHTSFVPWLKVKPYEEYLGLGYASGAVKAPNLYQLLPGEKSTGGYLFEVRNGTTPVALILQCDGKRFSIGLAGIVEPESAR
jgi:hypothetical protein